MPRFRDGRPASARSLLGTLAPAVAFGALLCLSHCSLGVDKTSLSGEFGKGGAGASGAAGSAAGGQAGSGAASGSGGGMTSDCGSLGQSCASCALSQSDQTPLDSFTGARFGGMASSIQHEGVIYTVDKGGFDGEVYYRDTTNDVTGTITLQGVVTAGWVGLAVGPCSLGTASWCIFVADHGGNSSDVPEFNLIRIAEPETLAGGSVEGESAVSTHTFDGEFMRIRSLMVHPANGQVVMVGNHLFEGNHPVLAMAPGGGGDYPENMDSVGTLNLGSDTEAIRGAAIHPCGEGALFRTGNGVYYARPAFGSLPFAVGATSPCRISDSPLPMGRGIAWNPTARQGFWSHSETPSEHIKTLSAACGQ